MRRLFLLLGFLLLFTYDGEAQLGSRYYHLDTLNINTSERDTTWSVSWETVTIYSDTVDVWLKIGAPDVGGWASREFLRLDNGNSISLGPTPRLKRITVKTLAGSGVLFIAGTKKEKQY